MAKSARYVYIEHIIYHKLLHRQILTFHTLLNRSVLGHLRFFGGVQGRVCVSRRRRFVRPAVKLKMSVRHVFLTWNMVSICTLGFYYMK